MKVKQFIQASSQNFTHGRARTIDTIVIHYTATNASALNNLKYFSRPGARASAHYFIDRDGGIYQSVREVDTAWHAGNGTMNARSIGIENVSAGEDFAPAQIAALRDVVTDIMRRHKVPASSVIRHHDVTGKACPAPYVNDTKWRELHSQITTPKPAPSANATDFEKLVADTIAGAYGNGEDRRKALGDNFAAVQAEVNRRLLGKPADPVSTPAPTPAPSKPASTTKSVSQMADEILAGRHGTGHPARRSSLNVSAAEYEKVRAEVNARLSGKKSASGKTIDQMAHEVIIGKHGNGHGNRRKSLGVSASVYAKVRKRVNQLLS